MKPNATVGGEAESNAGALLPSEGGTTLILLELTILRGKIPGIMRPLLFDNKISRKQKPLLESQGLRKRRHPIFLLY